MANGEQAVLITPGGAARYGPPDGEQEKAARRQRRKRRQVRAEFILRGFATAVSVACAAAGAFYAAGAGHGIALRAENVAASVSSNPPNGTGSGQGLPPAVELMNEVPSTLAEYVVNPFALCNDFGHAQQPIYVCMFQSALVSLTMTFLAMFPAPIGGGDPMHPGLGGFVFATWNTLAGIYIIVKMLFLAETPENLKTLSMWERYEFHWWLAAQNPKFQSMVTIFFHKLLTLYFTSSTLDDDDSVDDELGETKGWQLYLTEFIAGAAFVGISLVSIPLIVTHALPGIAMFPVTFVMDSWRSLDFYKMIFGIFCSVVLTVAILMGPASGIIYFSAKYIHEPTYGDAKTSGMKLWLNKGSALMALVMVLLVQDMTASSIMVYSGAAVPWDAQISTYRARQTCAWLGCVESQAKRTALWDKINGWVELSSLLNAAVALTPVDCYDEHGNLAHAANMHVFIIAMIVVGVITLVGCIFNPLLRELFNDCDCDDD
eukprot:TRINITY_DN21973_c0_g1_i1.p1 TRINITY_DN21973_c0_g1~~TRINITY_DN21973_c0_g1_i1.p1  ORF type:complete len:516 (+),score=139.01 TRINITY_DN21973_c0_g1_i1:82-1548(+)